MGLENIHNLPKKERQPNDQVVELQKLSKRLEARLQVQLAALASGAPDLSDDQIMNPDLLPPGRGSAVLAPWITSGYAPAFGEYIEDPSVSANDLQPKDIEALRTVLSDIEKRSGSN